MRKYSISLLAVLFSFLGQGISFAQGNTAYYMGTVPQSYTLNPATQPQCDLFIGVPLLSHTSLRANLGNIELSDIIFKDPDNDSVIAITDKKANSQAFINKLGAVEPLGMEAQITLLSFGFRVKEMYFSFDASIKGSGQISYPKELMEFMLIGPENGRTYDLSDLSFDMQEYTEIALNISKNFDDKLQVGVRPKFLSGIFTISSINNNSTLYTSSEKWVLNSNYQANIGATGIIIPVDEDGLIDLEGDFKEDSTLTSSGYGKLLTTNWGFGIDFGVHYKPIERIQLSLSVLDLGYIKWNSGTHVASVDGSYTFKGYDLSLPGDVNFGETVMDSISDDLNLKGENTSFKTNLTAKMYLGGRYIFTDGFDVGALYRTEFFPTYIDHDVILSANWHPIPLIALSGSYSLFSPKTFGLGIGLKLLPFNIYTVIDDIPFKYDLAKTEDSEFPIPVGQSDFNIKFGVNFVFGCNQMKKLRRDKPMYNSTDWIL